MNIFKSIRISCLLLFAIISLNVQAQVCQAAIAAYLNALPPAYSRSQLEGQERDMQQILRNWTNEECNIPHLQRVIESSKEKLAKGFAGDFKHYSDKWELPRHRAFLCFSESKLATCNTGNDSRTSSTPTPTPTPSPSRQPSRADIENSDEFKRLETAGDLAKMRGENAQDQADRERQGKKKTHKPGAEAHQCITVVTEKTNFGRLKNNCSYDVNFRMCNYRPKANSWGAGYDCEKSNIKSTGAFMPFGSIKAYEEYSVHLLNTERNYWFACRLPAKVADAEFVTNRGITGRCYAE